MASDLFADSGDVAYGLYAGEIQDLTLSEYPLSQVAPEALYKHLPSFASLMRRYREKRWRFVGLFSPSVMCGIAVVDTGYVGTTFAYVFDMTTHRLIEFKGMSPFASGVSISDHASKGHATFLQGNNRVSLEYGTQGDIERVDVDVRTKQGPLRITAEIEENPSKTVPHQVITPTPKGSFAFTHKLAGLPASGRIQIGDTQYDLPKGYSYGAVDHTAGYHDYHWEWRWACFGGTSKEGRSHRVEPGAAGSSSDLHRKCDLDGRVNATRSDMLRSPTTKMRFCLPGAYKPTMAWWMSNSIRVGERSETLNTGLIVSRFHQPIGTFNGNLNIPDGPSLRLEDVPGVVEDHEARW